MRLAERPTELLLRLPEVCAELLRLAERRAELLLGLPEVCAELLRLAELLLRLTEQLLKLRLAELTELLLRLAELAELLLRLAERPTELAESSAELRHTTGRHAERPCETEMGSLMPGEGLGMLKALKHEARDQRLRHQVHDRNEPRNQPADRGLTVLLLTVRLRLAIQARELGKRGGVMHHVRSFPVSGCIRSLASEPAVGCP